MKGVACLRLLLLILHLRYRLLGFRIEDLGCCKVISHHKFGRNVFVGCIVTNAAAKSDVMENIVLDLSH